MLCIFSPSLSGRRQKESDSLSIRTCFYRRHISNKDMKYRSLVGFKLNLYLSFFLHSNWICVCDSCKKKEELFFSKLQQHLSSSLTWPRPDPRLSFVFLFDLSRQSDFARGPCIRNLQPIVRFHALLRKKLIRTDLQCDILRKQQSRNQQPRVHHACAWQSTKSARRGFHCVDA